MQDKSTEKERYKLTVETIENGVPSYDTYKRYASTPDEAKKILQDYMKLFDITVNIVEVEKDKTKTIK